MKMVIAVRKDLGMSMGKAVAQGAHAAVGAALAAHDLNWAEVLLWQQQGQKKIVVRVDSEEALLLLEDAADQLELPNYLVRDRGKTEVDAGTATAVAIGPSPSEFLEPITGALKLFR